MGRWGASQPGDSVVPASSHAKHPYLRYTGDLQPRLGVVLRDIYGRPTNLRAALLGAFFLCFGVVFLVRFANSAGLTLIYGVLLVAGLALVGHPFIEAVRLRRHLRAGVVARARVLELESADDTVVSIDALTHGWAHGYRVVEAGETRFEEAFATDAPWSMDLAPGTEMLVVIDPAKRSVLLDLGLVGDEHVRR